MNQPLSRPSSRRPTLAPVVIVPLAILLLLAAYMGAYYAMLAGAKLNLEGVRRGEPVEILPEYRLRSELVSGVFWPAHQIDRHIRPGHWMDYDE